MSITRVIDQYIEQYIESPEANIIYDAYDTGDYKKGDVLTAARVQRELLNTLIAEIEQADDRDEDDDR